MNLFEITELSVMGDEHPEYGFTYWGTTNDGRFVRFSKKSALSAPLTIIAEKTAPKSGKKDYLQLTGVKVGEKAPESVSESFSAPQTTSTPSNDQLDRIETLLQEVNSKLDKLMGV